MLRSHDNVLDLPLLRAATRDHEATHLVTLSHDQRNSLRCLGREQGVVFARAPMSGSSGLLLDRSNVRDVCGSSGTDAHDKKAWVERALTVR